MQSEPREIESSERRPSEPAGGTRPRCPGSPIPLGTGPLPRKAPTLLAFLALGVFWGAWATVLPDVQHATNASKGALGAALLFVSLSAIPAMFLLAAPAVERFGARAGAITCAAFAIATTLPGLATSIPLLIVTLAATGATSGTFDVAINANAAAIERGTGRRMMPFAHGTYSAGVLAGAVAAGLARNAGVGREPILLAVAACTLAVAALVATDPARVHAEPRQGFGLARAVVAIGILGAAAFIIEGALENWSALFLERQLDAGPAVGGLGPGFVGASMAIGRYSGHLLQRVPDRVLLGGGATLAALGCTVAALAPSPAVGLVGFAIGGAGAALNAPVVFGAAGRRPDAAAALATVTTIGYVGLLVGPPLVGAVAQLTSLRVSFLVLAAISALVIAGAARIRLPA